MEKKELRLRKGTQVRVLRTDAIGKIDEIVLIRKNARVHRYCCLQMSGTRRKEWYDSSELGKVKEEAVLSISAGDKDVEYRFALDYKQKKAVLVGQSSHGMEPRRMENLKKKFARELEWMFFNED